MAMTRRSFLGLVGGVPVVASLAAGCGFFDGLVGGDSGDKTVNVAVFLPQGQGANFQAAQAGNILASLQSAANEINDQNLGFQMEVNLTVVPPGPNPNFGAFFGAAANAEPTPTPFSPIAETLNDAAASGELAGGTPFPDLLLISNMNELPLLYDEGVIEPFEQATRVEGSIDLSDFAPGAMESVRWQGQALALPLSSTINTLTYDADLLANDGVAAPDGGWTWPEMIEAGKRLTYSNESGSQWGTYAHASVPMLLSMIWSHGGEVFDAQNGAVRLAEPNAVKAIELWRDMIVVHNIAPNPPEGTFAFMRANRNGMQVVSFDQAPGGGGGRGGGGGGGGAQPSDTARLATAVRSGGNQGLGSEQIHAAPLPTDLGQATWVSPVAGLSVGAQAKDTGLAAQAALVLSRELAQLPVTFFGYPVYSVTGDRIKQVRPSLRIEDANIIADALGYSRGIPPLIAPYLQSLFQQHLMAPVLSGQTTVSDAAEELSFALQEMLRQ
ncbi:MAG: extracellular solute-binding protein [Chloroflexi bacterium]|nr:extracellular solute-binding protein [Chloroflexota bacterium]